MNDVTRGAIAAPIFLPGFLLALALIGPDAARAQTVAPPKIAPISASPTPPASPAPATSPAASTKSGASPAAASPAPASPAPVSSAPPVVPPAPPVTVIVQQPAPETNNSSSAVAGWIGLAILATGGFFGYRALKARGVTVDSAVKKLGIELPQDAPASGGVYVKPTNAASSLPPLPSLSDLPPAGAAPTAVGRTATVSAPPLPPPTGNPRLFALDTALSGQSFPLAAATLFAVGRDPGHALSLPADSTVSRRHARIEPQNGAWTIVDENSSNGTFVNGQRIAGAQPLSHGDEIRIGATRLRFEG